MVYYPGMKEKRRTVPPVTVWKNVCCSPSSVLSFVRGFAIDVDGGVSSSFALNVMFFLAGNPFLGIFDVSSFKTLTFALMNVKSGRRNMMKAKTEGCDLIIERLSTLRGIWCLRLFQKAGSWKAGGGLKAGKPKIVSLRFNRTAFGIMGCVAQMRTRGSILGRCPGARLFIRISWRLRGLCTLMCLRMRKGMQFPECRRLW